MYISNINKFVWHFYKMDSRKSIKSYPFLNSTLPRSKRYNNERLKEKKKGNDQSNQKKKKKRNAENNFRYSSARIGTRVKNGRAFSIFPEVDSRHRKPEE